MFVLFVCSVCLCVCLFVLFVCVFVCLFVCLRACDNLQSDRNVLVCAFAVHRGFSCPRQSDELVSAFSLKIVSYVRSPVDSSWATQTVKPQSMLGSGQSLPRAGASAQCSYLVLSTALSARSCSRLRWLGCKRGGGNHRYNGLPLLMACRLWAGG